MLSVHSLRSFLLQLIGFLFILFNYLLHIFYSLLNVTYRVRFDISSIILVTLSNITIIHCYYSVPHTGQNLWFMYDTTEEVDTLIDNLHPMGVRESALKKELTQSLELVSRGIKHKQRSVYYEVKYSHFQIVQ